jgi:pyruvate dehydrogenase E1 component
MTNLAGHDIGVLHNTFHQLQDDIPTCMIAYTIKGHGLPFAGHKDNHSGLMNSEQMEKFRVQNRIRPGCEWEPFEGIDLPQEKISLFLKNVPFQQQGSRRYSDIKLEVPSIPVPKGKEILSTQEGFGRILANLARSKSELVERIVTTSPDVTVSTNLGGWINRRGVFSRNPIPSSKQESEVQSFQKWEQKPSGQHFELGIGKQSFFDAGGDGAFS